jgi:hypothetical protein
MFKSGYLRWILLYAVLFVVGLWFAYLECRIYM